MTKFCFLKLYLGTENCLLSSVGKDCKDGHGLKIESFHALLAKITPKQLSWLVPSGEICLISSL